MFYRIGGLLEEGYAMIQRRSKLDFNMTSFN